MAIVLDLRQGAPAEDQLIYIKEQLERHLTELEDSVGGVKSVETVLMDDNTIKLIITDNDGNKTEEEIRNAAGVKNIITQYYLSESYLDQSGGEWTESQPAWVDGYYLWQRTKITWDDGTSSSTTPKLLTAVNDACERATTAQTTAGEAKTTATAAQATANAAQTSASAARTAAEEAKSSATAAATAASAAQTRADDAYTYAGQAKSAADDADAHALTAKNRADEAYTYAGQAATSAAEASQQATVATTYANSALTQLSTVEDVVGVLNWMQTHGKYKPTSDQAVVEDKAYWSLTTVTTPATNPRESGYFERKEITDEGTTSYIYEPTLDSTVTTGKTYYTISRVEEVAEDTNPHDLGYLELADINEAVSDYINARLALTDKGLYVVGGDTENEGYKILLASDGMTVYDAQGVAVSKFGENIEFSSTRAQYIGGETAYIVFNPEDGTINAGGEGFRFNNNMTLSDMLAEVGKVGGLEDDTNGLLQKTSSISYENNSLVISGGDSSTVKLVIGSNRISFYDGDNEVAYISKNQMCIPRSIVLDSLDMGDNKWRWTLNTDDHLTLQWIGG